MSAVLQLLLVLAVCVRLVSQYIASACVVRLRVRREMGKQYEDVLESRLHSAKLPFLNEQALRHLGLARTPDARLLEPIAVEGRVVNWIDSKAMFGDEETHATVVSEQLSAYVSRCDTQRAASLCFLSLSIVLYFTRTLSGSVPVW